MVDARDTITWNEAVWQLDTARAEASDSGLVRLIGAFPRRAADSAGAADIYGPSSYVPVAGEVTENAVFYPASVGYQLWVILLLLGYLFIVFGYRRDIGAMMRRVWRKSGDRGGGDNTDMPGGGVQTIGIGCGVLMVSVALFRACDVWGGEGGALFLSHAAAWRVVAELSVLLLAVALVQRLILQAVASVTFTSDTVRMIILQRISFFISATVTGAPLVLLAALSDVMWARVCLAVFAGVMAAHAALYIVRSFFLFVEQKVSILMWILYLCAVEAMPTAIAVIGLTRVWPV